MKEAQDTIDNAIGDTNRLRRILKAKRLPQVRSVEEQSLVKATALAWFNNYRSKILSVVDGDRLQEIDELYKHILSASDRATVRSTFENSLKTIQAKLSELRGYAIGLATKLSNNRAADEAPEFTPFVSDPRMQRILANRWIECNLCIEADAPLAATVMMGGLLEALLLARVNKEADKTLIFGATHAPKDKKTGKVLPLQNWLLKNYIDVAHELKWISQSAKEVGEVLRDYRNYIHPYKELSHDVALEVSDAKLFWEITKSISMQLIKRDKK